MTLDNRTGGAFGYTYDDAGRMASVSVGGVVQATYLYNYLGQQAIRTYPASGLTVYSTFTSGAIGSPNTMARPRR